MKLYNRFSYMCVGGMATLTAMGEISLFILPIYLAALFIWEGIESLVKSKPTNNG